MWANKQNNNYLLLTSDFIGSARSILFKTSNLGLPRSMNLRLGLRPENGIWEWELWKCMYQIALLELRTKNYNIAWSVYGYSCIMNFNDTVTELQSSRDISRS